MLSAKLSFVGAAPDFQVPASKRNARHQPPPRKLNPDCVPFEKTESLNRLETPNFVIIGKATLLLPFFQCIIWQVLLIAQERHHPRSPASFEPSNDYVVTKIPRFVLEKFPQADPTLTTQMKKRRRSGGQRIPLNPPASIRPQPSHYRRGAAASWPPNSTTALCPSGASNTV